MLRSRAVLALLAVAATLSLSAGPAVAAVSKDRAQRAVVVWAVHKYGVGTRAQSFCKDLHAKFRCMFTAGLRTGRLMIGTVYVNRLGHVHFVRATCLRGNRRC